MHLVKADETILEVINLLRVHELSVIIKFPCDVPEFRDNVALQFFKEFFHDLFLHPLQKCIRIGLVESETEGGNLRHIGKGEIESGSNRLGLNHVIVINDTDRLEHRLVCVDDSRRIRLYCAKGSEHDEAVFQVIDLSDLARKETD